MKGREFFKDLVSVDIETTGRDSLSDKIWSMGFARRNSGRELFINSLGSNDQQAYLDFMMRSSADFTQAQLDRGSLTPFFDSLKSNQAMSPGIAAQELTRELSQQKAVLIQNHNFENSFLGQMLQNEGIQKPDMRYFTRTEGFSDDGKFLYTPPAATSGRANAQYNFEKYLETKNPVDRRAAEHAFMSVAETYEKEFTSPTRKGSFVIDLMDITKATYAQASQLGLIDPEYMTTGTSVDFLSRNLMQFGEEQHTALDDAQRQVKIFDRLNDLRYKMKTGTMSMDDYQVMSRIAKAQPEEAQNSFFKAVKNTLEEIDTEGRTRVLGLRQTPSYNNPIVIYANTQNGGTESHELARANYGKAMNTNDWKIAFANVHKRYSRLGRIEAVGKQYGQSDFYHGLEKQSNNADRIKFIEEFRKNNGGMKLTNWKQRNVFQKIADVTTKQKIGGSLAVTAGGLFLINELSKQEGKPMPKKKIQDPNPYHGTGFYDFQNIKRHHEL